MKSIYIGGSLSNSVDRSYLEHITEVLKKAGHTIIFRPHSDVGIILQLTPQEHTRIFYNDLHALTRDDICATLLTGVDHDSGTCAEPGDWYTKGKACYGINNDIRWLNNSIGGMQ